jgi:hypothetical protein
MKSTLMVSLILSTFCAAAGIVFKAMQMEIGTHLLVGGVFLMIMTGALLLLQLKPGTSD